LRGGHIAVDEVNQSERSLLPGPLVGRLLEDPDPEAALGRQSLT